MECYAHVWAAAAFLTITTVTGCSTETGSQFQKAQSMLVWAEPHSHGNMWH